MKSTRRRSRSGVARGRDGLTHSPRLIPTATWLAHQNKHSRWSLNQTLIPAETRFPSSSRVIITCRTYFRIVSHGWFLEHPVPGVKSHLSERGNRFQFLNLGERKKIEISIKSRATLMKTKKDEASLPRRLAQEKNSKN